MNEPTQYSSLAGKVVLITGGASGIGAGIVRQFAAQNTKVIFFDIDANLGNSFQKSFKENVWFKVVDVSNIEELQGSVEQVCVDLGPIDILVNNVGDDTRHSAEELSHEQWRQCMAVNLDSCFFAIQAVTKKMPPNGSIINIGSINSILGPRNMAGYVTAKSGIIGLTKSLAKEYGGRRIRVNAVLPGWVVTEKQLAMWLTPDAEEKWQNDVAIRGRLMPEHVAKLVMFLASGDSEMITGQSFSIDAGRT